MKKFEIKITGGGTKAEICMALQQLKMSLLSVDDDFNGAEWEDKTLMTEISLEEEE